MTFYDKHIAPLFENLSHPLLLILRLFIGWQFAVNGLGKWQSMPRIVEFFGSLGIPAPDAAARIVATLELAGGLLLALGLAARLIAVPLATTMAVALATADVEAVRSVFSEPDALLMAAPFPFLVVSLVVVAFGPGAFSLDCVVRWMMKRGCDSRPAPGKR